MGLWSSKWLCRTCTVTFLVTTPPSTIAPNLGVLAAPQRAFQHEVQHLLTTSPTSAPALSHPTTNGRGSASAMPKQVSEVPFIPSPTQETPTNSAHDSGGFPSTKALWTTPFLLSQLFLYTICLEFKAITSRGQKPSPWAALNCGTGGQRLPRTWCW